jgi:hypothetical protein
VDEDNRVLVWTGGRPVHRLPPLRCRCPPRRTSLSRRARPQ